MKHPRTGEEFVPQSFICADCYVVYSFGTEGNIPLTTPPPCCLACGSENIRPTDLKATDDLSGIDPKKHIL